MKEERSKTPCAGSWSAWLCSWPNNPMFDVEVDVQVEVDVVYLMCRVRKSISVHVHVCAL